MWLLGTLHSLCSSVLRNERSNWDGLEPWELIGYIGERKAESAMRIVNYLGNRRRVEKTGLLDCLLQGKDETGEWEL